ncbi:ABC transporter substrate-binding protein [Aquisalibacillus elongatus]|uniref:ABC-type glycerol-3-phosphate transport system substrate-binding protein n=1 Tax=Aquisalibacillus elongatus TaxID=485577 RepID=A0A3N5BBE9_9BACI|nr:extracellular solute-binding protein [Aquisalibacillus elongatus]RPF54269.1 ABC-type glycerol-3-phosphate transport system substrate-binding protein [Aquisalibacillus elongatus]
MKKILWTLVLLLVVVAGCTDESDNDDGETTVEVMMFEGGFGSEWVKDSAESYMEMNEGVTIDVTSSPDIHQQLQTRFLSDDVPDLIVPGPSFDIQGVIREGMIAPLDDYLDENAYESDQAWVDTFEEGQFNLKKDGNTYGIPTVFASGYLWWYDEKLFNDQGWEVPQTQEELYELADQAEEQGKAVFAIPGVHPSYYFYGIYLPLVERFGGEEALLNAYNLEEGAWQSDAILKAAQESQKMVEEGLFMEGTFGINHTEAQTFFFQRDALFAMAGTWLEGEMADVIPEDFKLRALNQPAVANGDGEQLAPISTGWGGAWYIPEDANQKDAAIEFLKYLSSEAEVEKMVESKGLASVVKNTDDAIQSDALASALGVLQESSGSYAPTAINDTYPELAGNIVDLYQSLMLGDITPEEFAEEAEAFAEQTRNNDNVEKVDISW